jgi:hypothetical protein
MQNMKITVTEELSPGQVEAILAKSYPHGEVFLEGAPTAKVVRKVVPSITTPGTLLRNKLDDAEVLVVPTPQEIEAAAKANRLPPLRQNHHQLRILGDDAWLTLCEEDTIVIGWMDPTK